MTNPDTYTYTPTLAPSAGAGSGATAAFGSGDDDSGSFTVTTGSSPTTGDLAVLTFGQPFAATPSVTLIQYGGPWLNVTGTPSASALTVSAAIAPSASTEYTFAYQVNPSQNVYPYGPAGLTGAPFFTATDLANRLQIDPSTVNTDTATLLAQLASDAVREDIRQQVDYVENDQITIWGDNGEILMLPQRPVTAVSAVSLAGEELVPVQVNSTTTMLMYDWRPDGTLRRVVYGGSFYAGELFYKWPRGVPVDITYSHGYTSPPSAMKHVALELAAGVYSNPDLQDSGRTGWVEWATKHLTLDLLPCQRSSLDLYRNVCLTI
jgi:hypothetical protein